MPTKDANAHGNTVQFCVKHGEFAEFAHFDAVGPRLRAPLACFLGQQTSYFLTDTILQPVRASLGPDPATKFRPGHNIDVTVPIGGAC